MKKTVKNTGINTTHSGKAQIVFNKFQNKLI